MRNSAAASISIWLAISSWLAPSVAGGSLRYCLPRKLLSRGDIAANACDRLRSTMHEVQCVVAPDRMTCLGLLSSGKADFMVAQPEDLRAMEDYGQSNVLVTHQLKKFAEPSPQQDVEMVAIVRYYATEDWYTSRGKRLCYPGLETTRKVTFDYYYTPYFESWLFSRDCDPYKSLLENRVASLSRHFNASCIAGPWSLDDAIDRELKSKYRNLCQLCYNPASCRDDDRYYGVAGAMNCLRQGIGDVAWVSRPYASAYFEDLASYDYALLCPDGSLKRLSSPDAHEACTWITDPRPVLVANRNMADKVFERVTDAGDDGTKFYQIIHTSYKFSYLKQLDAPRNITDYLTTLPGYYSATIKSRSRCRARRVLRWCVSSRDAIERCDALRRAAAALQLSPSFACVRTNATLDALLMVADRRCDVLVGRPSDALLARRSGLKPLADLMASEREDANVVAAIVRKNSTYRTYQDMRGARACFAGFRSVGWNSLFWALNDNAVASRCDDVEALSNFFGESCVVGAGGELPEHMTARCGDAESKLGAEERAFQCLIDGADVAFVNVSAAKAYSQHKIIFNLNFKTFCPNAVGKAPRSCFLAKLNLGSLFVHENATKVLEDDMYNLFLSLDRYFGRSYTRETSMLEMYAPHEGVSNVLFPDATVKFERVSSDARDNRYSENVRVFEETCHVSVSPSGAGQLRPSTFLTYIFLTYLLSVILNLKYS